MMKCFIVIASFALTTSVSQAAELENKNRLPTKSLMLEFAKEMSKLTAYSISEEKFTNEVHATEIAKHLKNLTQLAKKAKHDPVLRQNNFKFSGQVLEAHIADTESVFLSGNRSFARWQFTSTLAICMGCHTQLTAKSVQQLSLGDYTAFASNFEQAEFLFATRDFENAIALYDKVIQDFKKDSGSIIPVEAAFQREVAYYSRIRRDPLAAIQKLKILQKNKDLPEGLLKNVGVWINQLEKWQLLGQPDPKSASAKQIIEFARKNIGEKWTKEEMKVDNPELIPYLRVSGVLYEYLNKNPHSTAVPEILYWLAICDRSISNTFFYSLADMYLRECIVKYPASKISQKCYDEYELETIAGYTGSAGTFLPNEVRFELNQLKSLIKKSEKKKTKNLF